MFLMLQSRAKKPKTKNRTLGCIQVDMVNEFRLLKFDLPYSEYPLVVNMSQEGKVVVVLSVSN